ncbi:MAG: RsmB/NOP family class I SAM-dependent RNA methyltransferase [Clostridia bacterium]|nr:RsmB/NOP family class I SAM-dependent RNA methyltransferase [Clostridia bacterium]
MDRNIPNFFKEMLIEQYGEGKTAEIVQGYTNKRKSSFRVNSIKTNKDEIMAVLNNMNIEYETVTWYENAFVISYEDEVKLRETDLYEEGKIYFQSLSSMIPVLVLATNADENVLDMAAAPGGKTTQMFAEADGKVLITACEKNKIRAERLKYNLEKQGASRVNVMMQDARKLDDFFSFDKVLLDAPCSGSGTLFLEDEKQIKTFTNELVKRSITTQKEMLQKALKVLKVGHEMVYSTCSILREENEKQLEGLLAQGRIEIIPIDSAKYIGMKTLDTIIPGVLCVCPDENYEGFFVAKIRKIK